LSVTTGTNISGSTQALQEENSNFLPYFTCLLSICATRWKNSRQNGGYQGLSCSALQNTQ
jgi:hypothetical protein